MSPTGDVVAKFYVLEKTEFPSPQEDVDTGHRIKLGVIKENRVLPDEVFGKFTPSGNIEMTIFNPSAAEKLKVGKAYLVTFEPVDD